MERLKDTEIDLLTDALTVLLSSLMQLNNDELTREEFNEIIVLAMNIMWPLTKRRSKTIEKMLN